MKYLLVVGGAVVAPFIVGLFIAFIQSNTREEPLASVFNVDTGENNQYQIKGEVEDLPKGVSSDSVFISLFQLRKSSYLGLVFTRWQPVSTIPFSADLTFSFPNVGAGVYKVTPLNNPNSNVYFPKSYQIVVRDHQPKPLTVGRPLSSWWVYIPVFLLDKGNYCEYP